MWSEPWGPFTTGGGASVIYLPAVVAAGRRHGCDERGGGRVEVFAGDVGASGTVDALLALWFKLVQHNGGSRRVALRITR